MANRSRQYACRASFIVCQATGPVNQKYAANPQTAELCDQLHRCMRRDQRRLEARLRQVQRSRIPDTRALRRIRQQIQQSIRLREDRRRRAPRLTYPEELPITARKDDIVSALQAHPVIIVAGDTGSGKTTQLPKMCLEAGRGVDAMIGCTQPRRVAALSISSRIAEELGVAWGREVGCKIRFTDKTSEQTYIKLVTDGMLLAELQGDRHLDEYDTIIIDEAHERSLNVDYLLGYLKVLQRRRPDLKIIVTSATIDTEAFSAAFDNAPVIQVSGRMYPVEARYWPVEELLGDSDDITYIDAAVEAVARIYAEFPRGGDTLVFMPTEGDIRETCELLEGRGYRGTEILPLFGRLSRSAQQRVFNTSRQRRIVVATNVAETSLTIPNIRFVVDTGLARISRFNPRTRTQRLPIEPVSRSSADQRLGRCGRVADGICIRLFSERDYQSRPRYTEPEIKRADLADVILHMSAHQLGAIERFPFIDPPTPQAIRGGYQLLQELNALDEQRRLTPLGREMARLPIAPTDARMLLQARTEGALSEVLVIAAALGIQDPRERPLEQQAEADQMHRQFVDARSDFITLLNIWNTYHGRLDEQRTQGKMRRFCRAHFLSYVRMREWGDIHRQLEGILQESGHFELDPEPAGYHAIHRAVLSGLLSNIARRKEGNVYQAARDREVMIFPGSGLFQRRRPFRDNPDKAADAASPEAGNGTPEWIMAAEIVETSRLFARTVAAVDPAWLADLGDHLCRRSYKEPYWQARSGRVLVQETLTLYGLAILTRRIPYRRIAPAEATEIFIREALIPGQFHTPHGFLKHNVRLLEKMETWQTRVSRYSGIDLQEAAADFYRQRLQDISSVHDLNKLMRKARPQDPNFLYMAEADLLGAAETGFQAHAFPDELDLNGDALPLQYAYRPGTETDGVTVRMPYTLAQAIDPKVLEWLVPGLLEEKITALLRSLPKAKRKLLIPIPEKAQAIAADLRPTHGALLESLQAYLHEHYRVDVRHDDWQPEQLPEHLRMRVEVQGTDDSTIAAGRDLQELRRQLDQHDTDSRQEAWERAVRRFEKDGLTAWTWGDQPVRVQVGELSGVPFFGYPGLEPSGPAVRLRLFQTELEARLASRQGLLRLFDLVLKDELKWLKRELRTVDQFKLLASNLFNTDELRAEAFRHLQEHLFLRHPLHPLEQAAFERSVEQARQDMRQLAPQFVATLGHILEARHQLTVVQRPYPGLEQDLERLAPREFLRITPYVQLANLVRYLQAALRRAERFRYHAGKDPQLAARVRPYQDRLDQLLHGELVPYSVRTQAIQTYRWMVEEYRVSVFAQELGTAQAVSPKRLDRQLAEIDALV